jgi:hypothetical protein
LLPDLLRAYGDMFQQNRGDDFVAFAVLVGVVLLLFATVTLGALIQAAVRGWNRVREQRHRPQACSRLTADAAKVDGGANGSATRRRFVARS